MDIITMFPKYIEGFDNMGLSPEKVCRIYWESSGRVMRQNANFFLWYNMYLLLNNLQQTPRYLDFTDITKEFIKK